MNQTTNLLSTKNTAKEDRDYLLDYKSIDLMGLARSEILDVQVDNVTRDEAVAAILGMVEKKDGTQHVVFIDPIKLMQMRPGKKQHQIAERARLVLADGAGLEWAAGRLKSPLKERIPMIAMLMDVIRLAEKMEFTIYLLGSTPDRLERVFFNLQRSFPGVRIIGRQSGHFGSGRELLVKESLRKSAPDIVFVGMGFPNQEEWIHNNKDVLANAVVFSIDGALDVLSGMEKKAPDSIQTRGLAWFWRTLTRPWNVVRGWRAFSFFVITMWRAFRQKG